MENALFDFLRTALIPELGTDVAASAASHIKLGLIRIAALRAAPDKLAARILDDFNLAIETAFLAQGPFLRE